MPFLKSVSHVLDAAAHGDVAVQLVLRGLLAQLACERPALGGDATLGRIGALDWSAQEYVVAEAAPYLDTFAERPGGQLGW